MFSTRSLLLVSLVLIIAVGIAIFQPFDPDDKGPHPIGLTIDILFLTAQGDTAHHEFFDIVLDSSWRTQPDTFLININAGTELVIDKPDTFRLALARKDPDGVVRVKQVFNHYTEIPGSFIKRTVRLDDAEQMIAQ